RRGEAARVLRIEDVDQCPSFCDSPTRSENWLTSETIPYHSSACRSVRGPIGEVTPPPVASPRLVFESETDVAGKPPCAGVSTFAPTKFIARPAPANGMSLGLAVSK